MGWYTDALYGPKNEEWEHQNGKETILITIHHAVNTPVLVDTELKPVLEEMAKWSEGTMNAADIAELILIGAYKLLTIRVNEMLALTACLQCVEYPQFTALRFCYFVGNRRIKSTIWADSLKRVITEYCEDFGIESIEAFARKGLAEKLCKMYGFDRLTERGGVKLKDW